MGVKSRENPIKFFSRLIAAAGWRNSACGRGAEE
jgi:hypothetical protein